MPVLTPTQAQEKDARARLRECFEEEITHLRAGDWRSAGESEVRLVGHLRDLHGPRGRCTCCPRRTTAGAA